LHNAEHRPCQLVKTNKYLIKSKGYVKFRAAPKQQGHDGEQAKYKYFVQRDHELFDGLNKHYKNQRVTENPAQMVFLYRSQRREGSIPSMLKTEQWLVVSVLDSSNFPIDLAILCWGDFLVFLNLTYIPIAPNSARLGM
jgi:hypothetical protein